MSNIEKAKELIKEKLKGIRGMKADLAVSVSLESFEYDFEEILTALNEKSESTSEFVKKNRAYFTPLPEEICDTPLELATRHACVTVQEACNIIDRLEAENKKQATRINKLEKFEEYSYYVSGEIMGWQSFNGVFKMGGRKLLGIEQALKGGITVGSRSDIIYDSREFKDFLAEEFSLKPIEDQCKLLFGDRESAVEGYKYSPSYDEDFDNYPEDNGII